MPSELSSPSWPEAAPVPLPDRHPDVPICSAPPIPQAPCPVCPRLAQEFEPWRQAAYWQTMHQRAVQREQFLHEENEQLHARIRFLEQQLFGRKADSPASADGPAPPRRSPRPRGQQRGRPGHKRRDYSHLPAVEQVLELPPEQQRCSGCGQPFAPFPGTDDTTVLEIEVRAHRRIYRRRRYRPTCSCGVHPGIVTAPAPGRVIPKSILGVSVWVTLLLDKFLFYRPTYRLLEDLATQGLDLSQGTLTDGLQRFLPLFEPLYDLLVEHSQEQTLWHADETRWLVFATWDGKVGYRWYLWVFHAADVVVFVLSPGRSHEVPEEHLGPVEEGILIVDRYAAYPAMAQVRDGKILLAFCWAHVRRDFLTVARSWPDHEAWALGWVERIGALYACNDRRLEAPRTTPLYTTRDQEVRQCVAAMEQQREAELAHPESHPARRKVLESLREHWTGLTVFVEHPEVPLDNNTAERSERGPVVGRKNYYGSGAVWSGRLAAMLFSLFQTLALWGINPRVWLTAYLTACAESGGQAPAKPEALLPWNLSEDQRRAWSLEPRLDDSS
ncbi:MAG: IS66 family transposase [Planctomycetaceae bacterium]|nr:IS66 family transposase [Planctomycetaceae bacterium]MBV8608061.1 IS66 family transposase [Singulisphaera sp.]